MKPTVMKLRQQQQPDFVFYSNPVFTYCVIFDESVMLLEFYPKEINTIAIFIMIGVINIVKIDVRGYKSGSSITKLLRTE